MTPNPHAKRVLCYGDSNTWGQNPNVKGDRFAANQRWTGVVQQKLGDNYAIIEEGLSSRTTDLDYARKPGRNGKAYFGPCLQSQNPVDLVLIMLGTNDIKIDFGPRPVAETAVALNGYIDEVQANGKSGAGTPPRIALISPVPINPQATQFSTWYTGYYDERSAKASQDLAAQLQRVADARGVFFFDAATVAKPGIDGVHISLEGHGALGESIAGKVIEWLQ